MNTHQCKVCRGPASDFNYGGLSCGSCKIFFRRNELRKPRDFNGQLGGHCQISVHKRHLCAACRLSKCLQTGMQADLMRTSRPKTHLLHRTKRFIQQSNPLRFQLCTDSSLPREFFLHTYGISDNYFRLNADFNSLSMADRSSCLRICADNVTCLGTAFSWHWSQLYNYGPFIEVFRKFYGDVPILAIREVLKYMDPDVTIAKLSISLFTFSNTISVLSLSEPNKYLNTLAIFHIQNLYVESLWNYLVHKYGYYHSIQRFVNVIQSHFTALHIVFNAQSIVQHVNDIESLVKKTELSLLLKDFE